jgi:hypothetical protein
MTAEATTCCSCLTVVPSARSKMDALLQDLDVGVDVGGGELCGGAALPLRPELQLGKKACGRFYESVSAEIYE